MFFVAETQIIGNYISFSTVCSGQQQRYITIAQHFVGGIHRWWVDFPYKGQVIYKGLLCHDASMIYTKIEH